MQVRMNVAIPARDVAVGDVVDVSAHEAEIWILNGNAEPLDGDAPEDAVEDEESEEVEETDDDAETDEDAETPEDFFDIN